MKKISQAALCTSLLSMVSLQFASAQGRANVDNNRVDQGGGTNVTESYTTLENPLGDITTVSGFIQQIIEIIILLAQPVLVLAFLWIGFSFVMAQGNATKLQDVRRNLWYTLLGAFVIIGAKVISIALSGTIGSLLTK